jgi:hypothetical protein
MNQDPTFSIRTGKKNQLLKAIFNDFNLTIGSIGDSIESLSFIEDDKIKKIIQELYPNDNADNLLKRVKKIPTSNNKNIQEKIWNIESFSYKFVASLIASIIGKYTRVKKLEHEVENLKNLLNSLYFDNPGGTNFNQKVTLFNIFLSSIVRTEKFESIKIKWCESGNFLIDDEEINMKEEKTEEIVTNKKNTDVTSSVVNSETSESDKPPIQKFAQPSKKTINSKRMISGIIGFILIGIMLMVAFKESNKQTAVTIPDSKFETGRTILNYGSYTEQGDIYHNLDQSRKNQLIDSLLKTDSCFSLLNNSYNDLIIFDSCNQKSFDLKTLD